MTRRSHASRGASLLAVLLALSSGCAVRTGAGERTTDPLPLAQVRRTAEYRNAEASYRRGDFSAALGSIESLLRRPDLSPEGRDYLFRQRDLSLTALRGSPSPGPAPAAVVATAAAEPPGSARNSDCGPRALLAVCQREGVPVPGGLAALRRVAGTDRQGTTLAGMEKAARSLGFAGARGVQMDLDALARLSPPAVAWLDGNHYVAVLAINPRRGREAATILDPNQPDQNGKEQTLPLRELLARSGGVLLTLNRRPPADSTP